MLTDTHCHLDFERFDADRDDVLARAWAAGLTRILIPGVSLASSRAAVELAESHPRLFAAIGIHPNDALAWSTETRNLMRALAESDDSSRRGQSLSKSQIRCAGLPNPALSRRIWQSAGAIRDLLSLETLHSAMKSSVPSRRKIVAIGEIGLDYYWNRAPHEVQQKALQAQLELAADLGLPVILHCREKGDAAHGDCAEALMNALEAWVGRLRRGKSPLVERPGVLHSFSGSRETAQRAIRLGFFIGVTGPVTFNNAAKRQEVAAALPLESLLIETDAPFLAPQTRRGRRNEPAFVHEIADKIAQIKSLSLEEVAAASSANADRLFSWGEVD